MWGQPGNARQRMRLVGEPMGGCGLGGGGGEGQMTNFHDEQITTKQCQ